MRRRVVCGLSETIATLPPQSAFTSVDFPTLGRPATATKPLLKAPYPHPGRGAKPTALEGNRTHDLVPCLSRECADCVTFRGRAGRAERSREELEDRECHERAEHAAVRHLERGVDSGLHPRLRDKQRHDERQRRDQE